MVKDEISISGRLTIELFGKSGELKETRDIKNLVVSGGRTFIAQSILKTSNIPAAMTHIGIGTAIMPVVNFIGNGTNTGTVTVTSTANLATGNFVTIESASGTEQSKFNGTYAIAVTGATTFTIVLSSSVSVGTYVSSLGNLHVRTGLNNSTLIGQIGSRTAFSSAINTTTSYTNDTVQYTSTFIAGVGTGSIREAGVFNAAIGGTMLCRTYFDPIAKTVDDSLKITWKIQVTSS